jgi:hypothetical protein
MYFGLVWFSILPTSLKFASLIIKAMQIKIAIKIMLRLADFMLLCGVFTLLRCDFEFSFNTNSLAFVAPNQSEFPITLPNCFFATRRKFFIQLIDVLLLIYLDCESSLPPPYPSGGAFQPHPSPSSEASLPPPYPSSEAVQPLPSPLSEASLPAPSPSSVASLPPPSPSSEAVQIPLFL